MKSFLKKFFIFSIFVFGSLLLTSVCFIGVSIYQGKTDFSEQTFKFTSESSEKNISIYKNTPSEESNSAELGESLSCSTDITTSFGYYGDLKVSLTDDTGFLLNNISEQTHFNKGKWIHSIQFKLLPYREGIFENVKIKIESGDKFDSHKSATITAILPKITISLPEIKNSDLQIIEKLPEGMTPGSKNRILIFLAITIILLGIGIYLFKKLKKEKQEIPLPLWEITEKELLKLSSKIKDNSISSLLAIEILSDIIRHYLAKQFLIKADKMTTPEFFSFIENNSDILSSTQKSFLKDFLNEADLIKFAGANAEIQQILSAIKNALRLVQETRPQITMKGENK